MNPPSAIQNAMGRERKPFTYTPGGLDLSEIKSERMAARLMRNAMNQGVPEKPPGPAQPPSNPSTPIAVPNYSSLPVQVFPAFSLPANPKSLLRTRSIPGQYREPQPERAPQKQFNNSPFESTQARGNSESVPFGARVNNNNVENRPASMYSTMPTYSKPPDTSKEVFRDSPVLTPCYDVNYFQTASNVLPSAMESAQKSEYSYPYNTDNPYEVQNPPLINNNTQNQISNDQKYEIKPELAFNNNNNNDKTATEIDKPIEGGLYGFTNHGFDNNIANQNIVSTGTTAETYEKPAPTNNLFERTESSEIKTSEKQNNEFNPILNSQSMEYENKYVPTKEDIDKYNFSEEIVAAVPDVEIKPLSLSSQSTPTEQCEENEQTESKVVKKTKKENKTEETNNTSENGEDGSETALTVKLPTKKSAAKTETKVEVVTKTLPDGSIEETKKTITKTTIDGKTEIKTRIETRTIPKEEQDEEEEEEEEEYEEESGVDVEEVHENGEEIVEEPSTTVVVKQALDAVENGETLIKQHESSESTTTKKVVVVQQSVEAENDVTTKDEIVQQQEIESKQDEEIKQEEELTEKVDDKETVEDDEQEEVVEEVSVVQKDVQLNNNNTDNEKSEIIKEVETKPETEVLEIQDDEESEYTEEEVESETEEAAKPEEPKPETAKPEESTPEANISEEAKEDVKEETTEESVTPQEAPKEVPIEIKTEPETDSTPAPELEPEPVEIKQDPVSEPAPAPELKPVSETPKDNAREIPIHLDIVEDIEIKPIGPISESLSKTHTESTEIITNKDASGMPLSTQTELHRVENIVVTNRITKTLDNSYDQLIQQGLPTAKTYFAPSRERLSPTPQPAKPYTPSYNPEPTTERRHSLLLERLSMERQLPPSGAYQNTYQTFNQQNYETQREVSQEPRVEVVNIANVKPSQITNQQWYQQSRKENEIYNNTTNSSQSWSQPPQAQYRPQATAQPQYQAPAQPQYQVPAQPQWQNPAPPAQAPYQAQPQYQPPPQQYAPPPPAQPQYAPQPQAQPQYTPQPQFQPKPQQYQPPAQPQYQPPVAPQYQAQHQPKPQTQTNSYTDSYSQNYSKNTSSTTYQQNSYPSYTPKPTSWGSNNQQQLDSVPAINTPANQYSYQNTDYQSQNSSQQQSSSYVPPPWEQDANYAAPPQNISTTFYQPATQPSSDTQSTKPAWKLTPAAGKFSKPPPKAYVPPAPNQSFVKPVIPEAPKVAGRKTYYSEYERRYISVPDSTYIPSETKYQPQPDPSPKCYYDNEETAEKSEHTWRKELREFTEKTTQSDYQTQQTVNPPWEETPTYAKTPTVTYTPTPSWSQTLRPESGRERSFESDYVSQDWSKTNTIGRNRPVSYIQSSTESPVHDRARGVSVDRYNANSYHSPIPSEHSPVPVKTLTPATAPVKNYHNPNVPAYHSRASAEPREQPTLQPTYGYHESRASPVQSRSFKYLQWITGTEH
ncbi:histone acetyltransferase KAT6A isoform X2 [Plutella xylostella]|uniref:histone acetyltransferase KAT6A isoform X2 n=1 Tax=Plutella xylostella TaxID=51655 RepID=UPI002032FC23|nr:histone acetyltransferase KAT6A isoform X2 [Plutella xylostella]